MLNFAIIRQLPLEKYIYFHQNGYSMQLKHELKQVLLHLFQQIYYINQQVKLAYQFLEKQVNLLLESELVFVNLEIYQIYSKMQAKNLTVQ